MHISAINTVTVEKGKDAIEQFIRDHRETFDDLKAPAGVWKRIEKRSEPRVHHVWKWSAIAASALLLVAVGYILGSQEKQATHIAGWAEFQETEMYYQSRINLKMDEIKTLTISDEVLSDIRVLDEVYAQLRTQLLEDPHANTEVLLSAMIKHQKHKLDVMDNILRRVGKYQSNETNTNHEM